MNKCYCGNGDLIEYSKSYYKCERCNVLVSKHDYEDEICNIKSETEDLYGKNYWEEVMVKEAGVASVDELIDLYIPERVTYWMKTCLKYLNLGSKIAEVGCGLGQFSYVLKESGFEQTSFELSPQICKLIEEKLGIRTLCGELSISDEKYQGIVAIDVFEHLLHPEQFLKDCGERLEEEGLLIFQMPCYDAELSYGEMLEKKPRFEHLLVEDQHTYLYSKEAIVALLKKYGFENVIFEPAFFGDDYDMFLFASKQPILENTQEEISQYLNQVSGGRIVKALIHLFDEKNKKEDERAAIDNERKKILQDVKLLTGLVNDKEKEKEKFSNAADERLKMLEKLTEDNSKLLSELEALKAEMDKRLADVKKLNAENEMLAAENKKLKQAAEERLADVEKLLKENGQLKEASEERLVDVEKLLKENKQLKEASEERLADVEKLLEENKQLKQAANERLRDVEKLLKENEQFKQAADERLSDVEKLLEENKIFKQAAEERLAIIERLTIKEENI